MNHITRTGRNRGRRLATLALVLLMALGIAVVAAGMCLAVVASDRGAKGRHAA